MALVLGIVFFGEDDSVRILFAFLPIFAIFMALVYSKIQSEIKFLFLALRNILKIPGKQRLNFAPDDHSAVFLKSYGGQVIKLLLLIIILAFVSYKLTLLISPTVLMHSDEKSKIFGALFVTGTLYALAFFLLYKNLEKAFLNKIKPAGGFILLGATLVYGMSFSYGMEIFLFIVAVEFYIFDWINEKIQSR